MEHAVYQEYRQKVWEKSGGFCWYCGVDTNEEGYFAMDHVVAQVNGGSDDLDNLVPVCHTCNSIKNSRTLEGFRIVMGRNEKYIHFTKKQRRWLKKHAGLNVDDIMSDPYEFWFEKEGLTLTNG